MIQLVLGCVGKNVRDSGMMKRAMKSKTTQTRLSAMGIRHDLREISDYDQRIGQHLPSVLYRMCSITDRGTDNLSDSQEQLPR